MTGFKTLTLAFAATIAAFVCARSVVQQPIAAAEETRTVEATPAWTAELTGNALYGAAARGTYFVAAIPSLTVFDVRSGKQLGQSATAIAPFALLPGGDAVATTSNDTVVRVALPRGEVRWQSGVVCRRDDQGRGGIAVLKVLAGDVFVGCSHGRVTRLDLTSGHIEVHREVMLVSILNSIDVLPDNVLAVQGARDGAVLRSALTLVRSHDLSTVFAVKEETQLVGAVGDSAILDDLCCNGRSNEYRPATIFAVDLKSGAVAQPVDLRPNPENYPADRIPVGLGWNSAVIVNDRLLLFVAPALFDYGDPRHPAKEPERLLDGLSEPATAFIARDNIFAMRTARNGIMSADLIDLTQRPIRVRRSFALKFSPVLSEFPQSPKSFAIVGSQDVPDPREQLIVRKSDGASIVLPRGCSLETSIHSRAFAFCTFRLGTHVSASIEAFDFAK